MIINENYRDYIERQRRKYGDKFDDSDLNPSFIPYYENQQRIGVQFSWGEVKRGRIGVTSGWKPRFLLMLTTRSISSLYTIGCNDTIIPSNKDGIGQIKNRR